MQAWIRRYAISRCLLMVHASLLVLGLLSSGCGVKNSDTAMAPQDDVPSEVTSQESIEAIPTDINAGEDAASEQAAAEEPEQAALMIESPVVPSVSELDAPRPPRLRTPPFNVRGMTTATPKSVQSEASAVVERRAEATVPQVGTLAAPTGQKAPQSAMLRADEPSEPAPQAYEKVQVFFATDRMTLDADADADAMHHALIALVVVASITLLMMTLGWTGWRRRLTTSLAMVGLFATLGLGFYWGMCVWGGASTGFGSWAPFQQAADPGVRYGDARGTLAYGTCDVTIPATHVSGEIERPSILRLEVREDVAKHVVLQTTEPQPQDVFFEQLRATVEAADRSEVFVFVHGYNVTFEGAARRTAQIAHDVEFSGAPIFFSWPSQGGLLKYTIDENNVQWAVPDLKQFLIDVTRRSGAKSVNLIAHSMGNRALTAALRELQLELGEETALFNQIILAAPDVDAEIFRRDLAPALVQASRRVTLYASSNDQALMASKKVHGYARAGDSGAGLVVLPGIETIDVSTLDTSLLGHSYYGSSDSVLLDIRRMIREALPAAQRPCLLPRTYGGLTYWVFEKMHATATREVPQLTQ